MRQDASGRRQEWFTYASGSVRVASGWRQDDVKRREESVRMASGWC